MIELWSGLPDNILGLTATGEVSADDYEKTLIPAVEDLLSRHEKIRVIYHLDEGFKEFSAAAVWDDAKMGMRHLTAWERIALVTDLEWLTTATLAIGFMIPIELKVFPCERMDAAREWIEG